MSAADHQKAREAARSLAKRGMIDAAVQTFVRVGDIDEASSVLVSARRFGDAGRVLLQALGVEPARAGTLDAPGRRLATKAAICFAQAGEVQTAVELFVALGDRGRAAEVLEKAGDVVTAAKVRSGAALPSVPLVAPRASSRSGAAASLTTQAAQKLEQSGQLELALSAYVELKQLGHAGRVARALKRTAQAAALFAEAGMPYEAAVCWHELGEPTRCLDSLLNVPRDDARYRKAAVQAVRLASELGRLDFALEHFLSKFVATPPTDERELESFYLLAKLYRAHDFVENAKDALRKLVAADPRYRDATARLAELEAETRGSAMVYEKILKEDSAFRRDDAPPPLPELPELPGLPPIAPAQGPRGTAVHGAAQAIALARTHHTPDLQAAPASYQSEVRATAERRGEPAADGVATFALGAIVAHRSRLEKQIGQGGMAAVFKATDLELGELVALKVFTHAFQDEEMLTRFKQELSLSRQLNHPNIVRLYDLGAHAGSRFITMELLEGTDLRARIGGVVPFIQGIDWLLQACAALQAAHDRGVIHRDIKPENFFVTKEGALKLMDFGIAKRQSSKGLTRAGMMAGTPEYISPEQVSNFGAVTGSTDLYALGVMAYEMFTGSVPFHHEELMPLLMMHTSQAPEPPRRRNPDIPPELEAVILDLLEKDPARRPKSCNELGRALLVIRRQLAAAGA